MNESDTRPRKRLLDVLRTQDPHSLKEYVASSGETSLSGRLPIDDSMWELAMHLMILQAPELSDLQDSSQTWLADREKSEKKSRRDPLRQQKTSKKRITGNPHPAMRQTFSRTPSWGTRYWPTR